MIRRAVSGRRSAERSLSVESFSIQIFVWHFVCATLALMLLNWLSTRNAHAAEPSLQPSPAPGVSASRAEAAANYGKVPLSFEPNHGQSDAHVQFISRGSGYSLLLTPGEAVLTLEKQNLSADQGPGGLPTSRSISTLRMQLLGTDSAAAATGLDQQAGIVNYFVGNDPAKWHTGIPTYGKVNYAGIYPGIDLVFYGNQRQLEYDFVVKPGSEPARIAWFFRGAQPHLGKDGALELAAPGGAVQFLAPVAYQIIDGQRRSVGVSYAVADKTVRFAVGSYDHSKTLIIDPILSYFSYLGGTGSDYIGNSVPQGVGSPSHEPTQAVGVDAQGNLYVAGSTSSTDFPVASAALSKTTKASGQYWAFVSKFSPDGSKLLYSTYIGGTASGSDAAWALAVDSSGNAYVTGQAQTDDFPVTAGAFQTVCAPRWANTETASCAPGGGSAFVLKLNPTGSSLIYSSFLGGMGNAWGTGVAIDGAGQAYVTGVSSANGCAGPAYLYGAQYGCFPTTANAVISDIGGGNPLDMAFMSVFKSDGSGLVYSTLFGDINGAVSVKGAGCSVDCGAGTYGTSIALDPAGNVYIGGWTWAANMLTTKGAFNTLGSGPIPSSPQIVNAPSGYGYVAKFAPVTASGTSLIYSTYFGGGAVYGGDVGGVAADAAGNAYITGETHAADFPTTAGAYQTTCDPSQAPTVCGQTGYVAKLDPTGTALVWATFFGSATTDPIYFLGPIYVDSANDVYVSGEANGALPLGGGVVSPQHANNTVYMAKFDPAGSHVLWGATATGANNASEKAGGMAVDATGAVYVAGAIGTGGSSFSTPGAFQQGFAGGGTDGFVAKVLPLDPSTTALTLSSASVTVGQSVTFTAKVTGPTGAPIPTGTVTFNNGTTALGTGTLDATGTGTYTTSTLAASTYSVSAAYAGDANYSSSASAAQTLTINPVGTTTALVISPNPATTGQSVTFTATVTPASGTAVPTGTITFTNGSTQLAAVALDNTGKAVYTTSSLGAATYSVTAAYSGDGNDGSSTSSTVSLVVNPAIVATTTTLTASATSVTAGANVSLTATVAAGSGTPAGTVTFLNGTTTLGTGTLNSSGVATYSTTTLPTGSDSITASYAANGNFAASVSAAVVITVNAAPVPDFSISISPTSSTVAGRGGSATATVTVTPINSFSSATNLTCSGLPAGGTCTFNPTSITPKGAAATSTMTVAISALASLKPQVSPPGSGAGAIGLSAASLFAFFGLGFTSRKLRTTWTRYLGLILILIGLAGALVGCGGGKKPPTGQYTVTVTGISGSVSHSVTYTLTLN